MMNKILIRNGFIDDAVNDYYNVFNNEITFKNSGTYYLEYNGDSDTKLTVIVDGGIDILLVVASFDNNLKSEIHYIIKDSTVRVNKFYCNKKVIERVNIKNCSLDEIYSQDEEKATFLTMDLSFISITKVIENIIKLANQNEFEIVSLIKPQFEAGKEQVGKNGVVREKEIHIEVINNVLEYCRAQNLFIKDLTFSPIKGPAGNIEYLVYLTNKEIQNNIDVEQIVKEAHETT